MFKFSANAVSVYLKNLSVSCLGILGTSSLEQRWGCAVDVAEVDSQGVHSERQDIASSTDGK